MTTNHFETLASINVNDHIEKKAGLSYLSWAWAVDQLMRRDPAANWVYGEPKMYGDTMMVYCSVSAFGKTMTAHLPVMDHRNRPIANPDAFQVNTAMQRCLVKAIALHGLGLYIYAGEDLPLGEEEQPTPLKQAHPASGTAKKEFDDLPADAQNIVREWALEVIAFVEDGRVDEAHALIKDRCESHEDKLALWSQLPSNIRSALKKERKAA